MVQTDREIDNCANIALAMIFPVHVVHVQYCTRDDKSEPDNILVTLATKNALKCQSEKLAAVNQQEIKQKIFEEKAKNGSFEI